MTEALSANLPPNRSPMLVNTRRSCASVSGSKVGHDAAPAQVFEPDYHLADSQATARPVSLLEPLDAADDQIGPQATAVVTKSPDSSVRGHQQWQDVKAGGGFVSDKTRVCANDSLDVREHAGLGPDAIVHARFAGGIERPLVTQQLGMRAGRDHTPAPIFDVDDAVPGEAKRTHLHVVQPLACHRLHRIPPDF
jgi:hypothetical protein